MVKYAWGDNEFIILCWWVEEGDTVGIHKPLRA